MYIVYNISTQIIVGWIIFRISYDVYEIYFKK